MERLSIRRFTPRDRDDQGTFGKLRGLGLTLFTAELPWRDNRRGVSCIPEGIYKVVWTRSPKYGRGMYLVTGVEGRSGVRIHSANFVGDKAKGYKAQLQGCVALGEKYGIMGGQRAIMVSRPAVRRFERKMDGKSFELQVVNVC